MAIRTNEVVLALRAFPGDPKLSSLSPALWFAKRMASGCAETTTLLSGREQPCTGSDIVPMLRKNDHFPDHPQVVV